MYVSFPQMDLQLYSRGGEGAWPMFEYRLYRGVGVVQETKVLKSRA